MPSPIMAEAKADTAAPNAPASAGSPNQARKPSETRDTLWFLVKLVIAVLIFRSFIFAPFSIPSESMMPRLLVGDYLFISKWSYGYSRYSLPFSAPLIPGRIFGSDPARGDVAVFKAPPQNQADYIKRVIGLPGDTIQMRRGELILNGKVVPKQRIADFLVPVGEGRGCRAELQDTTPDRRQVCRYRRYRETLPSGRSYEVLDQLYDGPGDNTRVYSVPAGHVFMMGDNRDDSLDSRFAPDGGPNGGIGFVPLENLEGKAVVGFWSADASARLDNPVSWFTSARWERIGEGF